MTILANFGLDFELLVGVAVPRGNALFVEYTDSQQDVFYGELFPTIGYDRFLQTDKEGNPRGVVALDPRELIS